jgi:hypothetical protein
MRGSPTTLPACIQNQLNESEQHALCQVLSLFQPQQRGAAAREFEALLTRLRTFCTSDDSGFCRRSIACGVIWLDPGMIAVHCTRLAKLIHRSKSFVNALLHPLSITMHKMSKARAIGLMARFPMLREETIGCWTFREIPQKATPEQFPIPAPPAPERPPMPSEPQRVRLPSVYTLLGDHGGPTFSLNPNAPF